MGWTDRFRRKPAMESRAEWGSSAIPLPNEGNANTYANVDLRRADSSLQKVAVWAAVTLLARLVSSLPLDTYRRRGDGPPANIGNSRFLDDPAGDGQGLADWLSQYMMSVLLRGNVYGKQILGPDAYPTQIVLYHPDTVDGWRDLYTGQVHWYVEGKDLGASGVWHRRAYPMPGNLLGMSPIGLHMTTIGQGMAAARFGYQFFADGAMPTGMLRNTEVAIDKRVADVAKARWMAAMHGSREVAVMGKGWEYQAIQVAPEESQFLETQKYTAAECARIYGPGVPEILGYETGGSMTYANVDQRSLHLLIYSLDPWLTGLERMFTAMLPQPQFVKFNRAALLRMTTDQRYAAYQTASLIGLQTPNEQRAMEDWGPVPWGDKPWVPAQQAPPSGQEAAGARALDEWRGFDPKEPRDPHTGKWGHGTGAASDVKKAAKALEGQAALDAAPAKLTPGPHGHGGDYEGEALHGPAGMGSVRALSEYEGVEYSTTNTYLREGPRTVGKLNPANPYDPARFNQKSNDENAARVAEIDKTMKVSRLTHDVKVQRVIKDGGQTFGMDVWFKDVVDWHTKDFDLQDQQIERWEAGDRPDLTGMEWHEKAYSSTTVDPRITEAYAAQFDQTKGSTSGGAVILNIHAPKGTGAVQMSDIGDNSEAEILLQRGLTMRVVADHGEDAQGRRILDVEVVTSE